jgi:hypothetical protein
MIARLLVPLIALIAALDATAQSAPKPAPTQVMIVGTFHLDNPGRDVFNVQVDDVLAKERQAELADIATALARFKPTEVMVEWPAATADEQLRALPCGQASALPQRGRAIGIPVGRAAQAAARPRHRRTR